jgi:hypothetical protein
MSEKKRKKKDGQDKGKRNQARRRANDGAQSGRDLPPDRPSPSTSAPAAARLKAAREGKGK